MENKFALLRQKPGISIGEFKKDFDIRYEALLGAGVTRLTYEQDNIDAQH